MLFEKPPYAGSGRPPTAVNGQWGGHALGVLKPALEEAVLIDGGQVLAYHMSK
jgi:hypothetical protein